MPTSNQIFAGSAAADITPIDSQFLYGYPHVPRMSSGVHDPLLASALFLDNGVCSVLFIGTDAVIAPREVVERARRRIDESTGIRPGNIMVTASHTHSGPLTEKMIGSFDDPAVPDPDPAYLQRYEDGIVAAGIEAQAKTQSAELGLVIADGTGLGGNRHNPLGPAIPRVPVLSIRNRDSSKLIAIMLACNVHPTVLHEDSTLVSADFPGLARQALQRSHVTDGCPIVYHMGVAGNQSPRHVIVGNTFREAKRLGELLASRIAAELSGVDYRRDVNLRCVGTRIELPPRRFPSLKDAELGYEQSIRRLEELRNQGAPRSSIRTAECDVFGAEQTCQLARHAVSGRLRPVIEQCQSAEVQCIHVGPWVFIGWPGEVFVEFAQRVSIDCPNAVILTLANHALHGYLTTQEAVDHRYYEAGNAIFMNPEAGNLLVKSTLQLLLHEPACAS